MQLTGALSQSPWPYCESQLFCRIMIFLLILFFLPPPHLCPAHPLKLTWLHLLISLLLLFTAELQNQKRRGAGGILVSLTLWKRGCPTASDVPWLERRDDPARPGFPRCCSPGSPLAWLLPEDGQQLRARAGAPRPRLLPPRFPSRQPQRRAWWPQGRAAGVSPSLAAFRAGMPFLPQPHRAPVCPRGEN